MESTLCSYVEDKVRLQLVRTGDFIEIRFNRRIVSRFRLSEAMLARYRFSHIVNEFVVRRDSSILLNMSSG